MNEEEEGGGGGGTEDENSEHGPPRTCDRCGETAVVLCSACRDVVYCSNECQVRNTLNRLFSISMRCET